MKPLAPCLLVALALVPREARAQTAVAATAVERVSRHVTFALYGAGTGVTAALLGEGGNPALAITLPLLGATAGFVAARILDRPGRVRHGVDTALGAGLSLGTLVGGAIAWEGVGTAGWSPAAASLAVWSGMTVGLGAGLALEAALRPDPGTTSWLVSGALYGATLAGLTSVAAGDADALGRWALVGATAGALAALATAGALRPTQARTRWTDLGAALGAALGLGAGLLLFSRPSVSVPGIVATTQLGLLGGAVTGFLLGAPDDDGRRVRAPSSLRLSLAPAPGGLGLGLTGHTP